MPGKERQHCHVSRHSAVAAAWTSCCRRRCFCTTSIIQQRYACSPCMYNMHNRNKSKGFVCQLMFSTYTHATNRPRHSVRSTAPTNLLQQQQQYSMMRDTARTAVVWYIYSMMWDTAAAVDSGIHSINHIFTTIPYHHISLT